ncbi:hypothetical protein [Clostridium beijerinckii]|uniref:hypothetical protein n=1 Tax=Clostridium beijerinckii TaxID=1520 RepID=UPI00098C5559|nr:hypothetical protein [Clostridium beijerinckii]NRT79269.1 hypothetical protein [Clostridium beijerinckii]OOM43829.1 hypothetical protein CBEIJ_38260 [Clostridium beijerinckii]
MITIYTLGEIKELRNISEALREELITYFEEIAKGIAEKEWQAYNLDEVGPILVIEEDDTIDVLDEYGLMQGSKNIPQALPEFALKVIVGGIEMLKIIWVCNDSFGLSVYYPVGKFGKEFDEFIEEYIME